MILNLVLSPTAKFQWLKNHWEREDYDTARISIFNTVCYIFLVNSISSNQSLAQLLQYRRHLRISNALPTNSTSTPLPAGSRSVLKLSSASDAARKLNLGISNLYRIKKQLSDAALGSPSTLLMEEHVNTEVDEQRFEEMDRKAVEDEIQKYECEALIDASSQKDFDLMRFWQVCRIFNSH